MKPKSNAQCDQIGGFIGSFLKPLATINLPKSPTFLGNFCKSFKSFIFRVKEFLGNFYRLLAIFSGHTGNTTAVEGVWI